MGDTQSQSGNIAFVMLYSVFYVPFRPLAFTEVKFNEKNDDDERVEMTCPFDSLSVQTNDNNFPLFFSGYVFNQ